MLTYTEKAEQIGLTSEEVQIRKAPLKEPYFNDGGDDNHPLDF